MKIQHVNSHEIEIENIEDAACEILADDGYDFEFKACGDDLVAYRSRHSRNSMGGARGMIEVARVSREENYNALYRQVIDNFSDEWIFEE